MRFWACLTMTSVGALSLAGCSAGVSRSSYPCPETCPVALEQARGFSARYSAALGLGWTPQIRVEAPKHEGWAAWTTPGDPAIYLSCEMPIPGRNEGYLAHVVAHEACHLSGIEDEGLTEACAFRLVPEWH